MDAHGFGGTGNTFYDATGTDTIIGTPGGNDTFVLNAGGGTLTINGLSTIDGDMLDVSQILPSGMGRDDR